MAGATSGAGTTNYIGAPEFTSRFSGICVARWLICFIVFCRLLVVALQNFLLLLCYCLSFFDLRLRIPLLVSSYAFFVCCNYNLALSAFMAYHLVCNNSSMTVLLEEHELLPFRSTCVHPQF